MRHSFIVLPTLVGVFATAQPTLAANPEAKYLSLSGKAGASCLRQCSSGWREGDPSC